MQDMKIYTKTLVFVYKCVGLSHVTITNQIISPKRPKGVEIRSQTQRNIRLNKKIKYEWWISTKSNTKSV